MGFEDLGIQIFLEVQNNEDSEVLYLISCIVYGFDSCHKIKIFNENCPEMDPRVDSFGNCFQNKKENRKVCFDSTGAYGLHVSPRCGAPKAPQKYTKKNTDSRNLFVLLKN